jgi:hypothetical protein
MVGNCWFCAFKNGTTIKIMAAKRINFFMRDDQVAQ